MEYEEEDNGAAGSVPEFGAIFMTSVLTKKECFKWKIFALPSSKAEFVKHIKAGMVLFLFEYDKRQLFGVYQASSDGAMNIVPNAFSYSGQRFPAQVCFTPLWYCAPLSEKEFRGAIRENYFSAKKFNFGLSEDQVRRLLYLFSSRKLGNQMAPPPLAEIVSGVAGKDRGLVGDDRFASNGRGCIEPTEPGEFNPALLWDHQVNSLARVKEDELLVDGVVNAEAEDFLAKRRRIVYDDRLITNDVAEDGIYNYGTSRNFLDSPKDPLDEERQLADARRLLTVEGVRNENEADKIPNPILSSEYLMGPLDVRTADDRFIQRNELHQEFDMNNSSWQELFASGRYGKPLDKSKHAIDDERFLFGDCVQREHNVHHIVKPMVYGDDKPNLHREAVDDYQCSMNRKLESRYPLDCDGNPVSTFERSANLLHKMRKTTSDGRTPIDDRIGNDPNFVTCSLEGFSSGNFSRPLHCGHMSIHDRKYPIVEGRVTESTVDSMLCSAAPTRNTGFIKSVDGRVVHDGRFRKGESINSEDDIHALMKPVMLMKYPSFANRNQNFSLSDKLPEKGQTQLTVACDFDPPGSTLDNATITRDVRHIPEHLNFSHGCSAMAANPNSSLVRENHPHHGSLANIYSLSKNRSSPYSMESQQCSRSLDILPDFRTGSPTNTYSHSSLLHKPNGSFLNSTFSMHMDQSTSAAVNNRDSSFSGLLLTSLPSNGRENIEGEKGYLFTYPSKSSKNHLASDGHIPSTSQDVNEQVLRMEMDMSAGKDFIFSEAKDFNAGVYHPDKDLKNYENQHFRTSSNMNFKEHCKISEAQYLDSSVKRRSVFTRLTSRRESQVGEERNDSDLNTRQSYMDATADQVMEMLQQGNNLSPRMPRNSRARQSKHEENVVAEKPIQGNIEIKHGTGEKKKANDASLAVAEIADEVPRETRILDFKRRSETKKNLVGTGTCSTADAKTAGINGEAESSMKTLRRRKLVRPVFKKTESGMDSVGDDQNLLPPGQILDKDDKRSCEGATSMYEAEMPDYNTRLTNVFASPTGQSMDCNIKEHSNLEEQKDTRAHTIPSKSHELKGHATANMGLQIVSSQALRVKTKQKSFGIQTSVEGILSKDTDAIASSLNLDESSPDASKLGTGCGSNLVEEEDTRMSKCKRKIITRPIWSLPSEGEHVS